MAEQKQMPTEAIDAALEKVLRAAGSSLRHYSMSSTKQALRAAMAEAMAPNVGMLAALDRIFSYVSYVNIHGLGEQPEPNGAPQPLRVHLGEFVLIFQEIGSLASAAIAKAEGRATGAEG